MFLSLIISLILLSPIPSLANNTIPLVDVKKVNSSIVVENSFASCKNFTGKPIHTFNKCYIHKAIAPAIDRIQKELNLMGLGLKIMDAYRPMSVQQKLWDICPDERYVANPKKGGRHTRGTAVDVTLIDLRTGKELEMPTTFDDASDFTEKMHRDYMDLPEHVLKNRQLLEDKMTDHGFIGLPTEWWHFDWGKWEEFEVLIFDFPELEQ